MYLGQQVQADCSTARGTARRDFLKHAGLGRLFFPSLGKTADAAFQGLEKSAADKPNIVFVLADQWQATLLGLAGVSLPKTEEGVNPSNPVRKSSAASAHVAPADNQAYRTLRTSRHTNVRSLAGPWLLFDDEHDPHQMNNPVSLPECAALQQKLDACLQAELENIGDAFRAPPSAINAWDYDVCSGNSISFKPDAKVQSLRRVAQGQETKA